MCSKKRAQRSPLSIVCDTVKLYLRQHFIKRPSAFGAGSWEPAVPFLGQRPRHPARALSGSTLLETARYAEEVPTCTHFCRRRHIKRNLDLHKGLHLLVGSTQSIEPGAARAFLPEAP
ncbi:hypothetical protein CYMTET_30816 [Cymbomonas tetramitiformis]|uniref:Uncharacterized protein n=1 Tax=Cymbomonas tetramitiformis TaxID=36881 RepID=A0AAE0FIB6_9CHLO|nr:hypothetical protein CYMTET_30816 [Cymbomonas tetramitiformis]